MLCVFHILTIVKRALLKPFSIAKVLILVVQQSDGSVTVTSHNPLTFSDRTCLCNCFSSLANSVYCIAPVMILTINSDLLVLIS
jgi:hypothetical protein